MAVKLAPAHREMDGKPLKTAVVARTPARTRPRVGARLDAPAHASACPYPDCPCEDED